MMNDLIRTEIGNPGTLVFDLVGDTENGRDGGKCGRHHFVVEHLHREGGGGAP